MVNSCTYIFVSAACMYIKFLLVSYSCILAIIWLMPPSDFVLLICDKIATSWDVAFSISGKLGLRFISAKTLANLLGTTSFILRSRTPFSPLHKDGVNNHLRVAEISATYQYVMIAIHFSSSLDSRLTSLVFNRFFVLSRSSLSPGAARLLPVELTALFV